MADKTPGSMAFVTDDFFIKTAGVKASEVLAKGNLCSTLVNQLAKITTDDAVLVTGFAQVTETITGNATNGGVTTQVITRGGKIIFLCDPNLESGQDVKLDVTGGVQKAIAASAVDLAAGKKLGVFLSYNDTPLTEDAAAATNGVIQT